jgi:hypothetical protein
MFAGQPYTLDIPDGWQSFDLTSAAGKAALDAFVKVNPGLAAGVSTFESLPNVRLAINPLLGNVLVTLSLPSQGLPLETIGQNFSSQFAAVPGLASPAPPEAITLPAGNALHWKLNVTANQAGGGKVQVAESVYLLVNATTAVIVEFVVIGNGTVPAESSIMQSFQFQP